MKKIILFSLVWGSLILSACSTQPSQPQENSTLTQTNNTNTPPAITWNNQENPLEAQNLETKPESITWSLEITDCSKDDNVKTKKTVLIKIEDINDPVKYFAKRKEAVDLINQCYTTTIQEEYQESETEKWIQEWIFTRKIIGTDQIFDKLMFYPNVNLEDYESFMGNGWIKYITTDTRDQIIDFYKDMKVDWYRSTPSEDENILHWTDTDRGLKTLTLVVIPQINWTNIIEYNYIEPIAE